MPEQKPFPTKTTTGKTPVKKVAGNPSNKGARHSGPKQKPSLGKSATGNKPDKKTAENPLSRGTSKISASLSLFLSKLTRGPGSPAAAGGFALSALTPANGGIAAEPMLNLLVRCDRNAPKGEGTAILSGQGTVRTALIPVGEIGRLAAREDVRRLSAPRRLEPLMDLVRPLLRVPAFRNSPVTGSSGKGVIVGIVDSGIDAGHAAFSGRILSIWDQTAHGSGPGGDAPHYGVRLGPEQLSVSPDTNGHGTHVTGIAAGAGGPYEGIAPDADIIVVKTNFLNSGILDAARWIFSEAERLGRPAVVNLSLGGHGDAHDGTDDLSVGLDEECGPGRLIVAAAGNEGTASIHASQTVTLRKPASFAFDAEPKSSNRPIPSLVLNGWYKGSGICEIRLRSSTGIETPWQGLLPADAGSNPGGMEYMLLTDRVIISTPDTDNPNGDRQFLVQIEPANPGTPFNPGTI